MKDFVPYQEALALKKLGFEDPCFGFWNENKEFTSIEFDVYSGGNLFDLIKNHNNDVHTNAPTFSQAFMFFREKYNLHHLDLLSLLFLEQKISYEQAELECVKKLIEIAKQKKIKT